MPTTIVRLTIKDLIRGDGFREQVRLLEEKITLQELQLSTYKKLTSSQDSIIHNFSSLINIKNDQAAEYVKLNESLQKQLYVERLKLKIYNGVSITAAGIFIVLLL